MSHVVVVIGGGLLSPRAVEAATTVDASTAAVIAADSGLDHAVAAGLHPTVLVGDLDSLSAAGRMWAYANGTRIDEHPPDKDATDTALAVDEALRTGADHLLLLGGAGDRLDHTLGTLSLLGRTGLDRFASITAHLGDALVHVLHPGHEVHTSGRAGDVFSLVALHTPCTGVFVRGARWPLADAVLQPGDTVGISNEIGPNHAGAHIGVAGGVLTVVIP